MRNLTTIAIASLLLAGCTATSQQEDSFTNYDPVEFKGVNTPHAMILVIGQSNAANSGEGLVYTAHSTNRIDNSYEAVVAESPVGSSGIAGGGGSFMPLLGDALVEAGKYDSVTYINVAVAGTKIETWVPDTPNFGRIEDANKYEFTHILFHQGESDYDTSIYNYKARFLRMLQGIRDMGIDAPIYVARTSYLNGEPNYDIIQAQQELINEYSDIYAGAYTDVLGEEYRYDSAHFNAEGLKAHAKLWEEVL